MDITTINKIFCRMPQPSADAVLNERDNQLGKGATNDVAEELAAIQARKGSETLADVIAAENDDIIQRFRKRRWYNRIRDQTHD